MSEKFGKIAQVIGPVVDVAFEGEGNTIPPIYTSLKIDRADGSEPELRRLWLRRGL